MVLKEQRIHHKDIKNGGNLIFEMSSRASNAWGE